jgi:quercetin dioxygenase-like cupin family protein
MLGSAKTGIGANFLPEKYMLLRLIAGVAAFVVTANETAQAQVKVLFENDSVRVTMATIKAHTTTPVHTHALPHVTYVQSGGELTLHYADSTTTAVSMKTGTAYWGKVETHAAENTGETDVILITVDLKKPPQARL